MSLALVLSAAQLKNLPFYYIIPPPFCQPLWKYFLFIKEKRFLCHGLKIIFPFFGEGRFFIELPLLGGSLKGTLACPCFRAAEKLAIALALPFSGRRGRRPLRPPFSLSPIKRRSQHLLSPAKRLPPATKKKSTSRFTMRSAFDFYLSFFVYPWYATAVSGKVCGSPSSPRTVNSSS